MAGPWGGYSNGRIPTSTLTALSWAGAQRLRSDAAAAFEQLNIAFRGAFNTNIGVTDSYRDYDAQVRIKAEKPTLAATPGTSNHGWALAVDLSSGINVFGTAQHNWMRTNAPRFGWIHPAWAQANGSKPEAWHWEFNGSSTTPNTPSEEDIMASIDELRSLLGTELASVVSQINATIAQHDARLQSVEAAVNKLQSASQVIFFSYNGGVWEADIDAATYQRVPNTTTLADRRTVLTRAGITWSNWSNSTGTTEVSNPSAFGRLVS